VTTSHDRFPSRGIQRAIVLVRGQRVIFDVDLAALYCVPTKALLQAVRRNRSRFPDDFMLQLTRDEAASLRSQIVTSKAPGRGGRRYAPYAFTEQGVAMLSSVLRTRRAVRVNIAIMRAFVQLRQMLMADEALARKVAAMEQKYDAQFNVVFDAIKKLMAPRPPERRAIGFRPASSSGQRSTKPPASSGNVRSRPRRSAASTT
jgi:hypothetical protein